MLMGKKLPPSSSKRRCDYERTLFSSRLWSHPRGKGCSSVQFRTMMHQERSSLQRGKPGVASGGIGLTIAQLSSERVGRMFSVHEARS